MSLGARSAAPLLGARSGWAGNGSDAREKHRRAYKQHTCSSRARGGGGTKNVPQIWRRGGRKGRGARWKKEVGDPLGSPREVGGLVPGSLVSDRGGSISVNLSPRGGNGGYEQFEWYRRASGRGEYIRCRRSRDRRFCGGRLGFP